MTLTLSHRGRKQPSNKELRDSFHFELNKTKYRSVSKNWSIEKIDKNYIECSNVYGGQVVLRENNIISSRTKMILKITNKNGRSKIKTNINTIRLIEQMVNWMRLNPTN